MQGRPDENFRKFPALVQLLSDHGHSAELLTEDMEEMKKTFLDWERAQFELAERLKQQKNGNYQPKSYTTQEKAKILSSGRSLRQKI